MTSGGNDNDGGAPGSGYRHGVFDSGARPVGSGTARLCFQANTAAFVYTLSDRAGKIPAGDTEHYQEWCHNPTASPCGSDFNTSNGYAIPWLP